MKDVLLAIGGTLGTALGWILIFALREYLRGTFATKADLSELAATVERVDKLTLGAHDQIGALDGELKKVIQYGSRPTRVALRNQRRIIRTLDAICMKLEIPPVKEAEQ